jgi:cytochrome c oxidase cbb3-type subunit 3
VKTTLRLLACVLLAFTVAACKNHQKPAASAQAAPADTKDGEHPLTVALVPLAPGAKEPIHEENAEGRRIMNDPEQIAAGKQLFSAMNCVGCHFNGGGGIGPPLMDQTWIYGSSIENIASTIREGRPNGMPSFRGFIPDEQIWQIAAYVRSLSIPPNNAAATQDKKK